LNDLNFNSLNQKFDIIFLDPPYKDKNLLIVLNKIIESKILSDNGIIVIHRHKKELDEFPKNFKKIEEKKYGISKIIFAKN
jgi:16S rRNA (guanine966-N2)-methyltransferase